MTFVEPGDEQILLSSIDEKRAPFQSFPASFLKWLCSLVEATHGITSEISTDALNETVATLHAECNSLPLLQHRLHTESEQIPLRQYVSLVGLGELLPRDSQTLEVARSRYDWKSEFSGQPGALLLDLLRVSGDLFVLEQPGMASVFAGAIQLIRSFPIETRLELYRRHEQGIPLQWIPQIERLPRLPETKGYYFFRAHQLEPCIVEVALSEAKPSCDCLDSIKNKPIALDVALLILADAIPDDIERLSLLHPHPDQLIELFVRLSGGGGDPSSLITELIQENQHHADLNIPVVSTYDDPDESNDVRPTILGWIAGILAEKSDDERASWLVNSKTRWLQKQPALPTEMLDLLFEFVDTESVRNRVAEKAINALTAGDDEADRELLPRELFSRLMISILGDPTIEDLPILCYGISEGLLQQELYIDSSLLAGIGEKAQLDPGFREAIPSLGVQDWPDQSDKAFWSEILSKNGLGQLSKEHELPQGDSRGQPDETSLAYWLSAFPNDRDMATYRFLEHWPVAPLETQEGVDEVRQIFASSEFDDTVKICILAGLLQTSSSIAESLPNETNHLAFVAQQTLNDIRLGIQNDEPDQRSNMDLCTPAAIVAGRMDNWWKALKHLILVMRHLKEPALTANLKPDREVDQDLQGIPRAFEFVVYRFMTDEELKVLRREMAVGLVEYLKPRRSGQKKRAEDERNSRQDGYDSRLKEPDSIWREAYLRALKDLGVKQRVPGKTFHGVLQKVAELDPSKEVRAAAMDCDRELNGLRSAWASGSHKRLISHAWWWIKQAHLISLNVAINHEEANRTRVTEFR